MRARLNLVITSVNPDHSGYEALVALVHRLQQDGALDGDGSVVVPGHLSLGAARLRVERYERPQLIANQVGGFRVRCPRCDASIVPIFVAAQEAYRQGGERALRCDQCAAVVALEALRFSPPAAYGAVTLTLDDVDAATIPAELAERITRAIGPWVAIARRI